MKYGEITFCLSNFTANYRSLRPCRVYPPMKDLDVFTPKGYKQAECAYHPEVLLLNFLSHYFSLTEANAPVDKGTTNYIFRTLFSICKIYAVGNDTLSILTTDEKESYEWVYKNGCLIQEFQEFDQNSIFKEKIDKVMSGFPRHDYNHQNTSIAHCWYAIEQIIHKNYDVIQSKQHGYQLPGVDDYIKHVIEILCKRWDSPRDPFKEAELDKQTEEQLADRKALCTADKRMQSTYSEYIQAKRDLERLKLKQTYKQQQQQAEEILKQYGSPTYTREDKFNKILVYEDIGKVIIYTDFEKKVKEMLVEKLDVKPEEILPESSLSADLGADSLDTVEFIMELEEQFGVSIPDDEALKLNTVRDCIEYISGGVFIVPEVHDISELPSIMNKSSH